MAAKHVKAQARDSRGNEIAIASTNSDSPLLPVEQLERLHQFRPDLVDFVVNETQEEAKTRRNENRKINFYTFIERIIGLVFSLIIALVGILGAIYLGLEGHDWLAGTLGTVTIGTLAVAYLKNK
ncbi:hypothetical protein Q7267_09410 [Glaesserella parasuis]|uniref:DUF2335 domain-containing protein n=2 Tax=Glaesserella parasuis TaxID=738 RepID=A0A836MEU4_GLAPU|nr:hypothetical protein [Glaesserella parasuis]EPZ99409.1 hypothetical protein HPSMNH_1418 [Glaesserella parasuis MN-H]EQA03731.1 hypothetical protein HPSSW114_0369 [Glaesserella parasuis SW114]EQA14242.1 hypothetical protein HPSH465_0229 [Glaesserella parasuis H465]AMW17539.1 hypothetical protein A4U84_10255 [Glaesserella parasuis]ATW43440.1 hypothetical protein A2U20_06350 [Glaesserella parasuis D74]